MRHRSVVGDLGREDKRGENKLGHSAPFPFELPNLVLDQMEREETILDPYSGSMTTARAATIRGVRSISIEVHREYCDLGLRLLREEVEAAPLFNALA